MIPGERERKRVVEETNVSHAERNSIVSSRPNYVHPKEVKISCRKKEWRHVI